MLLSSFFTTSGMDDHPATYLFSLTHLIYFLSFFSFIHFLFYCTQEIFFKKAENIDHNFLDIDIGSQICNGNFIHL